MNILLNPEIQSYLEEQVKVGRFASIDEAVNTPLATVTLEEALTPEDVEELRAGIVIGLDELDRGLVDVWDPADLKRRLRERIRQLKGE
jgi:Arc/MetJ-type ribon-helix-helix transcriptional regulator